MPGTTVPLGLPFPLAGDPTDVPGDVQALAEAADALMVSTLASADAATMPPCAVVRGSSQAVLNAATVFLTFSEVVFDNAGYADLAADSARLFLEPATLYVVLGRVAWAPNATGLRSHFVQEAGGAVNAQSNFPAVTDPGTGVTTTTAQLYLSSSPASLASIRLLATQSSGTTLQALACEMAVFKVGT